MNSHISDRELYNHITGDSKLSDGQLSHLAECTKCSELATVIKSLKKYIDEAEAKKK